MSIPKKIHYCWFSGDTKPLVVQTCIDSWSRIMPDYEIRCWGPDSFDFQSVPFVREAFEKKKWAFMADYVRLYALEQEGGIYLDSDVEVFKRFDLFLRHRFFIGTELSSPTDINVEAAIMGSESGHPFLRKCLELYNNKDFVLPDGSLNNTPMPSVITPVMQLFGYIRKDELQNLNEGIVVYPTTFFSHICAWRENLYAVHRLNHSWIDAGRGFMWCKKHHVLWLYKIVKPFSSVCRGLLAIVSRKA